MPGAAGPKNIYNNVGIPKDVDEVVTCHGIYSIED